MDPNAEAYMMSKIVSLAMAGYDLAQSYAIVNGLSIVLVDLPMVQAPRDTEETRARLKRAVEAGRQVTDDGMFWAFTDEQITRLRRCIMTVIGVEFNPFTPSMYLFNRDAGVEAIAPMHELVYKWQEAMKGARDAEHIH